MNKRFNFYKIPMKIESRVDIAQAIDAAKISAYQIGIFILCGFCLIIDGFDVQAMGYVAPAIIQDWKLQNAMMAPVFSATLIGVMIGAILFSMLSDKLGRRPVLIAATLFFSVLTLVTAPMLWPALFASFFLSVTFSWDEFIIAFLLTRFDTTLPVEIWNLLRAGLSPKTNAVGALVFGVSIVMAVLFELFAFRKRPA